MTHLARVVPNTGKLTAKLKRFYPWLVWGMGAFFVLYKYTLQVSPSVMADELMKTFQLDGEHFGSVVAYYFYAYTFMQLPVGLLVDRFGARTMITLAIFVCAGGGLLFSQSQAIWHIEAGRMLIGFGGAFSAVGALKLVTEWFPRNKFATLAGLVMTFGMIGAIAGQAPLAKSAEYFGWRSATLMIALFGFVYAALFWLVVREKKVEDPHTHQPAPTLRLRDALKKVLRHKQIWLISIYTCLAIAPISAFAGLWGIPFLTHAYPLSKSTAAGIISFVFLGYAMGAPLSGVLSEHFKNRRFFLSAGTAIGMLMLTAALYWPALSATALSILLFLFGLFVSFFFLGFSVLRDLSDPRCIGAAVGFMNMFQSIGGALTQPLIGELLDVHHHALKAGRISSDFSIADYHHALWILPVMLMASLILLHFLRETNCESVSDY